MSLLSLALAPTPGPALFMQSADTNAKLHALT